jgi:long-chain fatty acid transport protein
VSSLSQRAVGRLPSPMWGMRSLPIVAIVIALFAQDAWSTGFFINQQSVKGLGRVDAGNSAAADDISTIFFNPAGLIPFLGDNGGRAWAIETHVIIPRADFRDTGSTLTGGGFTFPTGGRNISNPTDPTVVPSLYWATSLSRDAAVALSVNAPFGLAIDMGSDWFGRYDATEASLKTINVSLSGALRMSEQLSIGGGIDFQYANAQLGAALPHPLGGADGHVDTKGNTWTPGFNVGVLYSPTTRTRIGAHYRSGIKHDVRGTTEVSGLGPFDGVSNVRFNVDLPAIATIGFRHDVDSQLTLLGEAAWYDWSTFQEIRTRFDNGTPDAVRTTNYRDAYGFSLGADYKASREWTVRGGVHYDTTPTVDAWRDTTVPDANRLWLGVGATWTIRPKLTVDFAFNHVFFRDTRINLTRQLPGGGSFTVRGDVSSVVNTLAASINYAY